MTSKIVRLGIALAVVASNAAAEAGVVRGTVRVVGAVPPPAVVAKTSKRGGSVEAGCGDPTMASPRLLVGADGGVRHAVVWLADEGPEIPATPPTALLDQRACAFEPHVVTLPVGGAIAIRNSDPVLHNVRMFQGATMLMHAWQKADAADLTQRLIEPGPYVVRCGVHPWMYAWVVVTPSRAAAVTDAAGRFTLPAAPLGRHQLHVWHETLGALEVSVEVRSDDTTLEPVVFVVS